MELPAPFGKYFLTDKIATGGMAEIFAAKLLGPGGFEKPLIIKQIHPELSGDREFVDMFVAEAKILVSLSHGNIVPVYELGVVDDVYFIAMEYIDGPTLRAVEKALMNAGTTMEPACAAFVIAEVLQGLVYAHRKGVIHRDLSPRNVMISREGQVKLVDFGIAVREEHLASSAGSLVGSYPYMSPEQVRGQALSVHSDIFSAGILLWEMLTGRDLFRRAEADATLKAVTDAPIEAPSVHAPDAIPEALERACLRALSRAPEDRFAGARQFLHAIQRYLYADDNAPEAPELARLVARYCPPETARTRMETAPRVSRMVDQPDESDEVGDGADEDPGTVPIPRPPPGEHTRPLPQAPALDNASEGPGHEHTRPAPRRARGKRAPTVRTFATRREFQEVLDRATPILPIAALPDEESPDSASEATPTSGAAETEPPASEDSTSATDERHAVTAGSDREPDDSAGRPRWLIALAVLIPVLGVAGYLVSRTSDTALHGASTASRSTTRSVRVDAGVPLRDAARPVATAPDSAVRHTTRATDAGPPTVDAPRAVASGTVRDKPRVSRPAVKNNAPGTLKVGANPWAEVYIDGKLVGRAPNAWPVPAGKHQVEVVFPVAGREQRKEFTVDIRPGRQSSLGVIDFSGRP